MIERFGGAGRLSRIDLNEAQGRITTRQAATEEWFCVRGDDRYENRNPAIARDIDRKFQPF